MDKQKTTQGRQTLAPSGGHIDKSNAMKYFLFIFLLTFANCHSQNRLSKRNISKTLIVGRWSIKQMTDNFYGDTSVYKYNIAVKFSTKDSAFIEKSIWNQSADTLIHPNIFSQKWFTDKRSLTIKFDIKKVDSHKQPILYGQFTVLTCTDSIVILRRNLDKDKWTRTFILE